MNKNKHLLLWSSLGTLALLLAAAVQENYLKDWRRIQSSSLAQAGPIDVRLRQVVVPGLKVTDRCVTCHVGMSPGEEVIGGPSVAQAHTRLAHDTGDFGCTVCHGGQPMATEKADAHGDVHFWPEPMIPAGRAHAGCGRCHAHLDIPERKQLASGQSLLERYDCLTCHPLDGRGGTLRPAGGLEGPDLSSIGAKGLDAGWYEGHLLKVAEGKNDTWAACFGQIPPADLAGLNAYLKTRVGAPQLIEAKALFNSLGCRGCHKVGGVGGDQGPDLTQIGVRDPARLDFTHVSGEHTLANWLTEHFRAPAKVVPGSQMPAPAVGEEQIQLLTTYMLSLRRGDFPGEYWPKDRTRAERLGEREFAADGATLFGAFCAGCHGSDGRGMRYQGLRPFPGPANPDFLAVADDEFITQTIRQGRPGGRMPAWGDAVSGLRPQEIAAIVGQLRKLGNTPAPPSTSRPARWAKGDVAEGGRLFSAYCAGCHGAAGQGIEGPPLNNRGLLSTAGDTYLFETINRGRAGTAMFGFAAPSPIHPALGPGEIESIVSFIRTWEQP